MQAPALVVQDLFPPIFMANPFCMQRSALQRIFLLGLLAVTAGRVQAQQPILVTEQELDMESNDVRVLCYHFAQGDRVVLDMDEEKGKALTEVSFIEAPGEMRWQDKEVAAVAGEELVVQRDGIYLLRLTHQRGGRRQVHVRVQRIPRSSATEFHETAVSFDIRGDSVLERVEEEVVVGYDSVAVQTTKRINSNTEYREEAFFVASERLVRGEERMVSFTLPWDAATRARDEKVVAWAYWIGVGEESNLAWEQNKELIRKSVKLVAGATMSPLGALAAGLVTELAIPPKGMGEDVVYKIVKNDPDSPKGFLPVSNGAGVSSYRKLNNPDILQGEFGVFLENDNLVQTIDVDIRVSAYVEVKYWYEEYGKGIEVRPRMAMQRSWRLIGTLAD
jgi:hypothetical protein